MGPVTWSDSEAAAENAGIAGEYLCTATCAWKKIFMARLQEIRGTLHEHLSTSKNSMSAMFSCGFCKKPSESLFVAVLFSGAWNKTEEKLTKLWKSWVPSLFVFFVFFVFFLPFHVCTRKSLVQRKRPSVGRHNMKSSANSHFYHLTQSKSKFVAVFSGCQFSTGFFHTRADTFRRFTQYHPVWSITLNALAVFFRLARWKAGKLFKQICETLLVNIWIQHGVYPAGFRSRKFLEIQEKLKVKCFFSTGNFHVNPDVHKRSKPLTGIRISVVYPLEKQDRRMETETKEINS